MAVALACETDALQAAHRLQKQWTFHHVTVVKASTVTHYRSAGRPRPDMPVREVWKSQVEVAEQIDVIEPTILNLTDLHRRILSYFDTHIAKQVAIQLREHGVDVERCEEVGLAEASDIEHLEYASKEQRVMVSVDKHFPKLHVQWLSEDKHHTGIFRVNPPIQGDIGTIVKALLDYHGIIEAGAGTLKDDIYDKIYYIG